MKSLHRLACLLAALASGTVLFGCGTREFYRDEAFRSNTAFSRRINGPGEIVCDSVKRALLDQGYFLEPISESGMLTGSKVFEDDEQIVTLRLQTLCMDNRDGSHTVFASAQQEVSQLQTLKQPAGISIGPIGGITLPTGSAKIPVTVKRETVQDADFYARFYKHIEELAAQARKR